MLAPQAERLEPGPLLDLCVAARAGDSVPPLAGTRSGTRPASAGRVSNAPLPLFRVPQTRPQVAAREAWPAWLAGLDAPRPPLNAVGGFVSPCLPGHERTIAAWRPPSDAGPAEWLDGRSLRAMEPALTDNVKGGWWYPLETWVDPVEAHACLARTREAGAASRFRSWQLPGLSRRTPPAACKNQPRPGLRLAESSGF